MNEDELVEKLKKELKELVEETSLRKSRRSRWVEGPGLKSPPVPVAPPAAPSRPDLDKTAGPVGRPLIRESIDVYNMLKALSQSLSEISDRLTSIEDSLGLARCADENCKLIALNGDYLCKHHREEVNHQSDVAQPS